MCVCVCVCVCVESITDIISIYVYYVEIIMKACNGCIQNMHSLSGMRPT